jgi:hypothetical protein
MRASRLIPVVLATLCLAGGAAVWSGVHPALGDSSASPSASPSPSYSATATPAPTPSASPTASPELVSWCAKWHRLAGRQRVRVDRLRSCLGRGRLRALPGRPVGDAASEWGTYGDRCKRLAYRWYTESKRDWRRIVHPSPLVSAAQWRPLLVYVGWPVSELVSAVVCIRRESGGRPWASNGYCFGLFQIHECHGLRNPFNPLVNCRYALVLWRAQGWNPWTTMRGY